MVKTLQQGLRYRFRDWVRKFYWAPKQAAENPCHVPSDNDVTPISDAEHTFLDGAMEKNPSKLARFRMTMKIHKTPFKFRPIVAVQALS